MNTKGGFGATFECIMQTGTPLKTQQMSSQISDVDFGLCTQDTICVARTYGFAEI